MRTDLRKYVILSMIPLGATVGVGLIFKDWVVQSVATNVAMNMKIILTMFFGAALVYWRMWQMLREDKALRRFTQYVKPSAAHGKPGKGAKAGKAADGPATKAAGDESAAVDGADDSEETVRRMKAILGSKAFGKLDVKKVLEPVVKTGGQIRSRVDQAAIEGEIHGMKEALESRWEFPNFIVGFMVALGLLGTFIGLLETLVGTSQLIGAFGGGGNLDEAIGKLVTGLQKPLAGMGTAFSASMFGLIGSLVLGMMMMSLRACGNALMGNVHGTILEFTERAGPLSGVSSANVSEGYLSNAMADMVDVQREAQETFSRSAQLSLSVVAKTDNVLARLDNLGRAVQAQTEATQKTNELIHVGPRMRELAERQLAEQQALVTGAADQRVALLGLQQVMESLEKRMAQMTDGVVREREVLRAALGSVTESQNATRALLGAVLKDGGELRAENLRETQQLRESMMANNASLAASTERLVQLHHAVAEQLVLGERQAVAIEQMGKSIEKLADRMGAGIEVSTRDAQAGRAAQIDVAKQLSGLATVLRLNNEKVVEEMTRLAESNQQYSGTVGMVTQEIRSLKAGVGREVRKEIREAVSQIAGKRAMVED